MSDPPASDSYASALDLPSVAEMSKLIKGMKMLTRFVARHLRSDVGRIEATVRDVAAVVDAFYSLLGDRSWIFHDHLNLEEVRLILDLDADEAERALINIYREPETLERMIRMLTRFPGMRIRMNLIEGARRDFLEGRYYSTVLTLLAVMDGFVNDFDAERRGLHTRTAEEMTAWDSVVGHHRGLSNAHRTFTKRFLRTSNEPIYELYRNGIMHGVLVNFDNEIIATKAWNRLFAVADWASGRQRQAVPKEPQPTLRALARQIRQNEEDKRILAAWQPRTVGHEEDGFFDEPIFAQCIEYLGAWKAGNYGSMAHRLSSLATRDTHGKTAGMVRDECENTRLDDFSIERLDFQAAAICEVDAQLVVNGEGRSARLRWSREGEDGVAALPNQAGSWKLVLWGPAAMYNRAASAG